MDAPLSSDDEGRGSVPVREYDLGVELSGCLNGVEWMPQWSGVDASLSSEDEGRGSVPVREYE